ncbi:MAG: TonB-dependent receptor [Verrucomicrobiales bacterium]
MNLRFAYFALSILPVSGGDDVITSSKSGLDSGGDDMITSSKSGLDSGGDDVITSSKSGLDSGGGDMITSSKSGLDSLPAEESSAKGVIDLVASPLRSKTRWNLGWGLSWRKIGAVDFDTGVSSFVVPGVFGENTFAPPAGIGPATGLFDRAYDNGFIRPGLRTPATGRTTDYEFQDQDQVQGDSLFFSATGGERRVITASSPLAATGWKEEDEWEISPYLNLSRLTDLGNGWKIGPSFHFSFTNVDGGRGGLNTLNASERHDIFDVSAIDRFDSTGLVLPNAPYTGSPGAIAPLLPVEPANRTFEETLRTSDTALFRDSVQESLDINLFGVSLGAEAVYQTNGRFLGGIGTGVVLNIADWDAKRSDRLIQVTNGGTPVDVGSARFHNSGTDLLFGFYLQGSLGYQLNDSWSVEANARYDWNESFRDSVGGSNFDVDLTGFTLGAGANYSF